MRALLAASKPDCNESLPGSHTAAGPAVPFEPLNSTDCANWILAEHRVCANAAVVRPNMDIFVRKGSFSAQLVEPRPHTMLANGCRQAAIFHFQGRTRRACVLSLPHNQLEATRAAYLLRDPACSFFHPQTQTRLPHCCAEWKKGWNDATSFSPSSTLDISVFKISVDGIFRLS